MIHVLIVDDDKLVRKGLISVMPWQLFEMKVVGEAANGEKALQFLEQNDVHLLITDLSMPVMSGIELIRIARKRYPSLAIAVLTMHQDFEYIQEALRLGAIDYIAKVQLEKEQFEEVLARIYARIMDERLKKQEKLTVSDIYYVDAVFALVSLKDKPYLNKDAGEEMLMDWRTILNGQAMIWTGELDENKDSNKDSKGQFHEKLPLLPSGIHMTEWKLLNIKNTRGVLRSDLHRWIESYRQQSLFYECDGSEGYPLEKVVSELQVDYKQPDETTIDTIRQLLHSFQWIHEDHCFKELEVQLKEIRLAVPKLMQLLYGFTVDWNRLFRAIMQADATLPDHLLCWKEVDLWMRSFREKALKLLGNLGMNRDVSSSIMSAIKIVHDEYEMPLFAIDVAKRVNLSRSYFNECFKKVSGYSFNEYLRKVRIDKARDYLMQTM